jgi:serine/threonine-protein kinase HipA
MTGFSVADYQPGDSLYLWWLGVPERPRYVGELMMARSLKGVSLRYDDSWIRSGFALSEDLPLTTGEHLPRAKETAAGAVDDARPERWGERVIAYLDKPLRRALLDLLWYCGDERFGALGVSVSRETYLPRRLGPLPQLRDVGDMELLVQRIFSGEPVAEQQRRLIAPGVTMGGARPKGLMQAQGSQWVVKFSEPGEDFDSPLVEHASMTLCRQAGIQVAESFAIALAGRGHAVAIKRFDRSPQGRIHAVSAGVALRAAGQEFGYPELAQLLRRIGPTDAHARGADMKELFRRMVANILLDNTDDHERNHVLLAEDTGAWRLSPAFDVLPTGQALGYQQMRVGRDGHDASLANALSESRQFGLTPDEAQDLVREVSQVVAGWQAHFRSLGVSDKDIAHLSQQIDRPFLLDQRQAYTR